MPSSTLHAIVMAHHRQAAAIARHTLSCRRWDNCVPYLRAVGVRFTPRVERRLRNLDIKKGPRPKETP